MTPELYEGPNPEKFLTQIATSNDAFSSWFRANLVEAHGLDLSAPPPPPPELAIDESPAPAIGVTSSATAR